MASAQPVPGKIRNLTMRIKEELYTMVDMIAAVGNIEFSGLPVLGETITIGADVYTWVETRSGARQVTLGSTPKICAANLIAAIAADSGVVIADLQDAEEITAQGAITVHSIPPAYETVNIGDIAFAWLSKRQVSGEIEIGISASACLSNLIDAVNADSPAVTAELDASTAVAAAATIVVTGIPTLGKTVTIDGLVMTWASSRSTRGKIAVGVDAAACAANLAAAINADMSSLTATAESGVVTLTATAAGSKGNDITLSTNATQMYIAQTGAVTIVSPPTLGKVVTVMTQVFTWVASRAGDGQVTVAGTAADCAANLASAINTDMSAATAHAVGTTVTVTEHVNTAAYNLSTDAVVGQITIITNGPIAGGSDANVAKLTAVTSGAAGNDIVLSAASAGSVTVNGSGHMGATRAGVDAAYYAVDITAKDAGTAGNEIVFTSTSSNVTINGDGYLGGSLQGVTDYVRTAPSGLPTTLNQG